jgi:hypothetical protein
LKFLSTTCDSLVAQKILAWVAVLRNANLL